MTINIDLPAVKRPLFFDGERLTAADLLDAETYERALRWLHNRCLHPWGIALGLAATGARGDKAVAVGAGYALDCRGRDLIVADSVTLQVPPVADDGKGGAAAYLLTVSYLDDDALPAETRVGVCGTSGAVRLPERALVRWQTIADVDADTRYRPGLDVVIAGASVKGCKLDAAPSTAERQEAAVPTPYVAGGRTEAGRTGWSLWPDATSPLGVTANVSTSSAGFGATPRYQAEVVGTRAFQADDGSDAAVDGFVEVANVGPSSFDVCVLLSPGRSGSSLNPPEVLTASFLDRLDGELGWYVTWVGVEG
jgi:hypothetical protein